MEKNKKNLIIYILKILEKYSDCEHILTHNDIIKILSRDYGIVCERKAVGRNIAALRSTGCEIITTKFGSYHCDKVFDKAELKLLIDSVLFSKYINSKHSSDLINKLIKLGGANFNPHISNIFLGSIKNKSKNYYFLLNIEIFDEAIEKKLQVAFHYNTYNIDIELVHTRQNKQVFNPYQLLLHNQRYYIVGNSQNHGNINFYRVDKITDIELLNTVVKPITELEDYSEGLDLNNLISELPYLYPEKAVEIELKCPNWMLNEIIDWFGIGIEVTKLPYEHFITTIKASPKAIMFWLMQYCDNIEVLKPQFLRDEIKACALKMYKKYT